MPQYAITFDVDTTAARAAMGNGYTVIYADARNALATCGFTEHPQWSVYHTRAGEDGLRSVMMLPAVLQADAPRFCQYVRRVHVFRMEEWSDVTELITGREPEEVEVTPELEAEQMEAASSSSSSSSGR
jgi:virulence-associated protein VapD